MREIILCKYGEITLKGDNRPYFEKLLRDRLRKRVAKYGNFNVYCLQSTVYIEPQSENCDIEAAYSAAKNTFGVAAISRAAEVEKDIDAICKAAGTVFLPYLDGVKTFKVESKRSDKTFPLTSPEISAEVGGAIYEGAKGRLKVDIHNPEVCVRAEIRDKAAYLCAGQERAIGGMPTGSNGKGLLLLSGGIDSPVAGFMLGKRGVTIEGIHFESFPYTSERAKEKVIELAGILSDYTGEIHLHIVSLTKIQEALRDNCEDSYFTLLLRRSMMRIAERTAEEYGCGAIITGESLGQVASQTMQSIGVTDICAKRPVFRPLIGMDKEEIVQIARSIGTFDTSVLPYEDCCTVFTPRHPRTRPELFKVEREEEKIALASLEEEAFRTLDTVVCGGKP